MASRKTYVYTISDIEEAATKRHGLRYTRKKRQAKKNKKNVYKHGFIMSRRNSTRLIRGFVDRGPRELAGM